MKLLLLMWPFYWDFGVINFFLLSPFHFFRLVSFIFVRFDQFGFASFFLFTTATSAWNPCLNGFCLAYWIWQLYVCDLCSYSSWRSFDCPCVSIKTWKFRRRQGYTHSVNSMIELALIYIRSFLSSLGKVLRMRKIPLSKTRVIMRL